MKQYISLLENELSRLISTAELEPIARESMLYSLMAGGKRIRPVLTMLVCECCGGKKEDALPYACALEMIHTYSLIHDDLPAMDNDDERRGKPSSHIQFGEGNAILAGDGLLTLAGVILTEAGNPLAASAIMKAALKMLNGQFIDINADKNNVDESILRRMYLGKTAGLFEGAVISGAYAGGEKRESVPEWKLFADELGMLFQITDDFLDEKQDAHENKTTYLSLFGREKAADYANSLFCSLMNYLKRYNNEAAEALVQIITDIYKRIS